MHQFNTSFFSKPSLLTYHFFTFIALFALFIHPQTVHAQLTPISSNHPSQVGSLLIIGGALRKDNAVVWTKLVQSAGGNLSKIAIIPSASGNPERAGNFALDAIQHYGGNAFILPLSNHYPIKTQHINQDQYWVKQIDQATGVYFTGGDQARITQALLDTNGQRSPLLEAIWRLYQRGGIIAGTSAGAAMMSTTMFHNTKDTLTMLKMGMSEGIEIAAGLGFIGPDIFIDQHLIIRGRFARMLPAMLKKNYKVGLGIDENTALFIQAQEQLEIVGYKGAILIDLNCASTQKETKEFNLNNAYISFLSHGDKLNLKSLKVTPALDKSLITQTQSEDHDLNVPFYPNILGNTTVIELMSSLIEGKHQLAKGLAMGHEQSIKSDLGFEFEFKKTNESQGFFSSVSGAESFTLLRIRMNVRPVRINHPIYTVK